jgi:hypothetical protein
MNQTEEKKQKFPSVFIIPYLKKSKCPDIASCIVVQQMTSLSEYYRTDLPSTDPLSA